MSDASDAMRDVCSGWPALLPPTRMRVTEGAARNLFIKVPGGASGYWNPSLTPYMVEPTDTLASRVHSAVCFVGPSRTGKTVSLIDGWFAHNVVNDPGDMAIFQMNQEKAREYSKSNIDRALRNSPSLRAMKTVNSRDDNTHDKWFRNGMLLKVAWPTASNMSSSSYRYVACTDYDRWPDNIDGEGDGFTLASKRTATFLSRGMVSVESSPGRPVTDPTWKPASAHEAPPVEGILGIYNRSDRRRWYWKCPHCGEWMEATPGLSLFGMPSDEELLDEIRQMDIPARATQYARILCPACGCVITSAEREGLNAGGRWLADGLTIDSRDRVSGTARTSSIAGFWMGGVAAVYVKWEALVRRHLQALLDYQLTGAELSLQTTANTDQGVPYMSRRLIEAARNAARGDIVEKDLARYIVPEEALFLVAFADVQGGVNARFVVQVHAIGPHKEEWLVDRYTIDRSPTRVGVDGEPAPLDPAAYPEDWDALKERVLDVTYRTHHPDREMRVHKLGYDTGGEDGVTDKAYAWYRKMRSIGLHHRIRPCKGHGGAAKVDWHVREAMVGNRQGKGDIPLLHFDPNKFKDMVSAGLARREPGPGYYHWPAWLRPAFFDELRAEVRLPNGTWSQIKPRNESFDLCVGIKVVCMDLGTDARRDFWANPPPWALPQDAGNTGVVTPEHRRAEQQVRRDRPLMERRIARSSYLG